MLKRWRRIEDRSGSVALEFALVAPLMFALVFAIVDFSRAFYTLNDLTAAVREGVRFAASLDDPVLRQDEVKEVVKNFALNFGGDEVTDDQIEVAWVGSTQISVVIRDYPFEFMTPLPSWFGLSDTKFTRTAVMKWERAPLP